MNKRQAKKAFKKKHGHNPFIIPHHNIFPWKNKGSYEYTHRIMLPVYENMVKSLRKMKGGEQGNEIND